MSKRKREPDIIPEIKQYDVKLGTDIIKLILVTGQDVILSTIMALLRDRPWTLIKIYNYLGIESINKERDSKETQLIKLFLNNIFKTLWFLSCKSSFPLEFICAFEYDYYVKHYIDYEDMHDWRILFNFMLSDRLGIKYNLALGKDVIFPSALKYYENTIEKLYTNTSIKKNYREINNIYSLAISMESQFDLEYRPYHQTSKKYEIFKLTLDCLGINAKFRRIFTNIMVMMKNKFEIFFGKCEEFIKNQAKISDNIKAFYTSLTAKVDYLLRDYSNLIYYFQIENKIIFPEDPNNDKVIMDVYSKAKYFNFFYVVKTHIDANVNQNMLTTKSKDEKTILKFVQELYDDFSITEYKNVPDYLINIIENVEREFNFPDNYPFRLFFRDFAFEDRLLIDYQDKFAWFYSYFDKNSNKIVYLNVKEINQFHENSAFYWYALLYQKLSDIPIKERNEKFSLKI
jgi:hypothetical protein